MRLFILTVNTIDLGLPHSLIHIFRLVPCRHHSSIPFTKLLSSDTRKATALAISSGVPTHPSWWWRLDCPQIPAPALCSIPKGCSQGLEPCRTNRIDSNFAFFEVEYPIVGKRSHGSLGRAINTKGWDAYGRSNRGAQNKISCGSRDDAFCTVNSKPLISNGAELITHWFFAKFLLYKVCSS
jgi:hypothetical protein